MDWHILKTNVHEFLKKLERIHWFAVGGFLILAIAIGYVAWYGYNRLQDISNQVTMLQANVASTTQSLKDTISQAQNNLTNNIRKNVGDIQDKLGNYQQQVGTLSGTLNTLQKLSKTDPQLLEKYSKIFFLNENYAPAELIAIPDDYKYSSTKYPQISTPVWIYMKRMFDDATVAGIKIYVFSGYRSFSEQSALKSQYKVIYGIGTANSFSADQGYSEHQLGTAMDFITTGLGGQLDGFDGTSAYTWLITNAYKYGFILSYPKNNSYYVFEPWHWRFVGVKLATDLHNANQNFYDWDQRTIDNYLVNLFD